ncbi:response regulator transcription factor [Notoacmeibacter sp. MSK16QG-6]|uniref:response regulator n=1 Tax=Notoacmeibacter sp. MSK16QG-6 TaxID=2957982 RepID=UPI00209E90F1|nr:response regulator transcription factor [Notoacmeibacter sp. MSK16QG-6]MCP1199117.1 response regulator transcription factor [Notoacmeibacter sp. MSK16QG-6]
MRVLIVEDAADVAEAVAASLERAGFACDIAPDLSRAAGFVEVQTFDVLVLDINLPDGDGRDFLRDLRRRGDRTPVLMLTARFEVTARVDALDEGADDYLVKPFDLRELEARVRVLTRRNHGMADSQIVLGRLTVDMAGQTVRCDGALVPMTRREMALLNLLMAHRGQIMSKERLFEGLFSFDSADVGLNTVELYVARLRKKLAGADVAIETHRGLGYRLDVADG